MCLRGKKFTALFLVFCIVALSGNLTAQVKKGVKLSIILNDGQEVNGELITVKSDSLLILDSETQADVSLPIREVKTITVKNKSLALELGILGALGGAAVQGLQGVENKEGSVGMTTGEESFTQSKSSWLLYGVIAGGAGLLIGSAMGMSKKIQIQGRSDADIQQDLEKLSKKARVKGIQ